MRKEIMQFRSWDGLYKKMSFWTMNDLCSHIGDANSPSALDEWTQYTELLDKNGKKIYEGDVVAGIEGIGRKGNAVISFKEGVFGIDGMSFPEGASEYNWTIEEAEIIGNIYQN